MKKSQWSDLNRVGVMQGEKVGQRRGIVALSYARNRGRLTYLHQIRQLVLFAENFPLKIDVSLFLFQLLIHS